jgi:hypothetical protein
MMPCYVATSIERAAEAGFARLSRSGPESTDGVIAATTAGS